MKKWLITLPDKRLKLYAELSAFEAALLAMPPASECLASWQTAAALVDLYPGYLPAPTDQTARDLLALRETARDRLRTENRSRSAAVTVPEPTSPTGSRRGRRTATRPATTLSTV
ncbi:hypothetical protein [Streptomyces sp. NPDC087300]|uniref:hypothetical protein n=1 Tax=Streptomyces sp. NPDC087300 TaxID=3365780 RepID=UPI0038064B44